MGTSISKVNALKLGIYVTGAFRTLRPSLRVYVLV